MRQRTNSAQSTEIEPECEHKRFWEACATEERIRSAARAVADASCAVFIEKLVRGYISIRRRMMVSTHVGQNAAFHAQHAAKLRERFLTAKGYVYDPDDTADRLSPIEYLVAESFFFGSKAHAHCDGMRRAYRQRNSTETNFSKESVQITEVDPETHFSAPELQYMFSRYFPNPDFDLEKTRWSPSLSRALCGEVQDMLQNVHNVSPNLPRQRVLETITPFEWEALGKGVQRCGFACYQHYKHRHNNEDRPMTVKEHEVLLYFAREQGFRPDGTLPAPTRSFDEVWAAISAKMRSRSAWECFAAFQTCITRLKMQEKRSRATYGGAENQYFNSGTEFVPFLPFEDKVLLDAHAAGVVDYVSLTMQLQAVPRTVSFVERRLHQRTGLTRGVRRLRHMNNRDERKMRLLQVVYGADAGVLAPLHFSVREENNFEAFSKDLAEGNHDNTDSCENDDLFQLVPMPAPAKAFAFCSPKALRSDIAVLPELVEEPTSTAEENTVPKTDFSFVPSCCTVDGIFIPSLAVDTAGVATAYERLRSHFTRNPAVNISDDEANSILRGPQAIATRNAIVGLFGNFLARTVAKAAE